MKPCDSNSFDAPEQADRPSVKQRAAAALRALATLKADGLDPHPVVAHGKKLAQTFWGVSWCRNVDVYGDYETRLPRGRSLLRGGCVLDLRIEPGIVSALVFDCGIVHRVRLRMTAPDPDRLAALKRRCAGKLASLLDLLSGNLSEEILETLADPACGLFPEHAEIRFDCDCFDDAVLCPHAAAVLYAVGPCLDDDPSRLFTLRGIVPDSLFGGESVAEEAASGVSSSDFSVSELADSFGITLEE